jgi:hypothetical protein
MAKAKMIVRCKNWNSSGETRLFHSVNFASEISNPLDTIQVLNHQNQANIDEDAIILVIIS